MPQTCREQVRRLNFDIFFNFIEVLSKVETSPLDVCGSPNL